MKDIAKTICDNSVVFEVSKNIYDKKAITSATSKFINICYVFIDETQENTFKISLKTKVVTDNIDSIANEFCNELLDQQVRVEVEHDFGDIRNLIVKQAFSPIEKP